MDLSAPDVIYEHLDSGEEILKMVKTRSVRGIPEFLFLTDRRVIYYNKKVLGRYDIKGIPYSKLSEMEAHTGKVRNGSIIFRDEENEVINLDKIPNDQIEPFISALETAINNIAVEPISIDRSRGLLGNRNWSFNKAEELVIKSRAPETRVIGEKPEKEEEDPLQALKLRFVKGEITKDEYLEMKELLE